MTETDDYIPPVQISAAAFSKGFRMCSKQRLREAVERAWRGKAVIYQESDSNVFHVRINHRGETYWAVVSHGWNNELGNTLTVVTQMHGHRDYQSDPTTARVESIPEALGFVEFIPEGEATQSS